MRRFVRTLGAMLVALAPAAALPPATAAASDAVREIALTGTVDPFVAGTIERGVSSAARDRAQLLLIRIDTPGGLDSAMRRIVQAIGSSSVPVVCWVGPPGARAASAGAIVLLGCPVAAMAPGTNTGAAHPVGFRGEVLGQKVTNDAAAYARSLAERWGRNAGWAEDAVRKSESASAEEALRLDVIDLIAANRSDLLRSLSGRSVRTARGDVQIPDLTGATIDVFPMRLVERVLHSLVDPTLAFILFLLGAGMIAFEFFSPGGVGGVVGALFVLASVLMLGMLPVNIAGLVLLVIAIVFFVVEVKTPGTGWPTALGIASLILGGLFLFDVSVPNARVSRGVVVGTAVGVALFFVLVAQAILKARRMPSAAQALPAAGSEGKVLQPLSPQGVVYAAGEEWTAVSAAGDIPAGVPVRIVGSQGLTLRVEPLDRSEVGG